MADADELLASLAEKEEANFALFGYVNELGAEVDKLGDNIDTLRWEAAHCLLGSIDQGNCWGQAMQSKERLGHPGRQEQPKGRRLIENSRVQGLDAVALMLYMLCAMAVWTGRRLSSTAPRRWRVRWTSAALPCTL
jgi:hypothetical protein